MRTCSEASPRSHTVAPRCGCYPRRVLKVTKLGLGQQAYFEKQVAQGMDDYYSGKGEAPGEWRGRLATELGLAGQVSAAQFNALLAGVDPRDPDLEQALVAGRKGERKVAAYDLTFSAPKSVSVLAAVADDGVSRHLREAHEAAVSAALEFLEDEAARVRRGHGGEIVEKAGGLVAASYRHRMSRSLDPQLHTHVIAANLAPGRDGRWTSLDARPLYRMAKAAGTIYQAHLRAEVVERLALSWREPVKGLAELEGVDQGVLDEFSQRRHELRRAALEQGLNLDALSIRQREKLSLQTRSRKQYAVETNEWRDEVRARAAEHGLDRAELARLMSGRAVAPEAVTVGDTLNELTGPDGLTEMSNAFERADAIIGVAGACRQGMRGEAVLAATDELLERADVLPVVGSVLDRRWTTAELAAVEQRLIARAVGRAREGVAQLSDVGVRRAVQASERTPNDEQYAAVLGVATSGNGVDVIEARAGTGKTYVAGLLREAYEANGHVVIGVAPTGAAARTLTDEAGIRSWTLHSMLGEIERYGGLSRGTVVLLDEAGMADTRHVEQLLDHARSAGVKVVAVGDSEQLPSVQAGGWLRSVGNQVGRYELRDTMRQNSADERRALGALHAGTPGVWLNFAEQHDQLALYRRDEKALAAAIDAWTEAVAKHGVDQAVLISRDNAMRGLLNAGARQHWDEQGRLGARVDYGPIEVAEGDRIICRNNDRLVDVDNGTRGVVRAVDDRRVLLETDAGTVRELPASYVAEHVEYAYALTGHGMQGATVEWAGVVATPEHMTKGWSYTALSRAREKTMLYVSDEGPEADPNKEQEGPVLREVRDYASLRARIELRMHERDDEDLAVEQLPEPFIGAGRAGDERVVGAPDSRTPIQERGAEPTPAARPGDWQLALIELRDEHERIGLQIEGLPVREVERLDALAGEHHDLLARRREQVTRLEALGDRPGRGAGSGADERRRLGAFIAANDERLQAMQQQHKALRAQVAEETGRDAKAVRDELRGLRERQHQLEEQQAAVRDRAVAHAIENPPAWVEPTIGPRPIMDGPMLTAWEKAIRETTRAQLEMDPAAPLDRGLPATPDDTRFAAWRRADEAVRAANRRTGREAVPDVGRDLA